MEQFKANVSSIMEVLRAEKFSASVVSEHRLCYKDLTDYLTASNQCYSPDVAYHWLEENKPFWAHHKYTGWKHCIDQLEDVRKFGYISPDHLAYRKPAYDQLSPYFKSILDVFIVNNSISDKRYRRAGARFLLYLQNKGIGNVTELSYKILLQFHQEDHHTSWKSKDVYEDLIREFLRYLATNGLCPPGLPLALNKLLIHKIIELSDEELRECSGKIYPSITVDTIDAFMDGMEKIRYGTSVLRSTRHILTLLYIFLDMHNADLNEGLLWYWFHRIKPLLGSGWKQHRRSLCQFLHFLDTGIILTGNIGDPQSIDPVNALPEWERDPFTEYLCLLKREGWQPSTIAMQRSSNLRFCRYLRAAGINRFSEVTPAVLRDFNLQDNHRTPEGKAAYNCRIRSFIIFLYEQGLVEDPYLYKALPAVSSPRVTIVQTLSKEEVKKIWAVDPDVLSPIALRDYAMVCIGLSMGFRASDITNLHLENIDWKQRCIRITQKKTGRILTMPMPVKTGNILFRYLRDGRPKSGAPYVFINHKAPYDRISRGACRNALTRFITSSSLASHCFHSVRKTFATQMLEGSTKVELISDSLGHSTDDTVHKYLALDEERMRMCPLSMAETGIPYQGGAFHV